MGEKLKRILLTIPLIFILSCAAISSQSSTEKQRKARTENLKSLIIEDGINLEEAEILSSEYFWRHISACGVAGEPTDGGDYWLSIAYLGGAGIPLEDKIKINKKNGTISMKGYPTIVNPLKSWEIKP